MPLKNQNPSQIKGQILFTLSISKATLTSIKAVFVTWAQIKVLSVRVVFIFSTRSIIFFFLIKIILLWKALKRQKQMLPVWPAWFSSWKWITWTFPTNTLWLPSGRRICSLACTSVFPLKGQARGSVSLPSFQGPSGGSWADWCLKDLSFTCSNAFDLA